jgi:hypothetical protein
MTPSPNNENDDEVIGGLIDLRAATPWSTAFVRSLPLPRFSQAPCTIFEVKEPHL